MVEKKSHFVPSGIAKSPVTMFVSGLLPEENKNGTARFMELRRI